MSKQEIKTSPNRLLEILRFGFFGAIGFGIGSTIAVPIASIMFQSFLYGLIGVPFILFIAGMAGSALLGIAVSDKSKTKRLILNSSLGLFFGFYISYFVITPLIFNGLNWTSQLVIIWMLIGAIGGAMMGLALKSRIATITLALIGATGFAIGEFVYLELHLTFINYMILKYGKNVFKDIFTQIIGRVVESFIVLSIGGASLGLTLGYLKTKEKIEK